MDEIIQIVWTSLNGSSYLEEEPKKKKNHERILASHSGVPKKSGSWHLKVAPNEESEGGTWHLKRYTHGVHLVLPFLNIPY